ncbi:MAG TPA: hypothetical protein VME20_00890 [Acidimicrobiales bacterium]|nr:hypothetical protein [Acidimicrobiales bacterium]
MTPALHGHVARAVAAAPAPMGEYDQPGGGQGFLFARPMSPDAVIGLVGE